MYVFATVLPSKVQQNMVLGANIISSSLGHPLSHDLCH